MDCGAWWAAAMVSQSQTRRSNFHFRHVRIRTILCLPSSLYTKGSQKDTEKKTLLKKDNKMLHKKSGMKASGLESRDRD